MSFGTAEHDVTPASGQLLDLKNSYHEKILQHGKVQVSGIYRADLLSCNVLSMFFCITSQKFLLYLGAWSNTVQRCFDHNGLEPQQKFTQNCFTF